MALTKTTLIKVDSSGNMKSRNGRRINLNLAVLSTAVSSLKVAAYTVLGTDCTVRGDTTAASLVFTLPTAASSYDATTSTGQIFNFKKSDSGATTNTLTVKGDGTELIDLANTSVLSGAQSKVTVQSNGTAWMTI